MLSLLSHMQMKTLDIILYNWKHLTLFYIIKNTWHYFLQSETERGPVCLCRVNTHGSKICTQKVKEDVPLVEFMYLVSTRMPGASYHRRPRSLLLCLCDIFRELINSLVRGLFYKSGSTNHDPQNSRCTFKVKSIWHFKTKSLILSFKCLWKTLGLLVLQVEPSTHMDLMTSRRANTQLIPSQNKNIHIHWVVFVGFLFGFLFCFLLFF